MSDHDHLARALRRGGFKLTAPRRAVLQVLENSDNHLSPAEIFARARAIYPSLGLTTVYRTLDLLTAMGYLRPAYLGDNSQRYATHTGGHHHHLLCSACGAVVEVEECGLASLADSLMQRTRFRIDGHYLEFYGLCERCQCK